MMDVTERPTVTPIAISDPLTAIPITGPAPTTTRVQPAPPTEVTEDVSPPLPPAIVRPTDDHVVLTNKGCAKWKKILLGLCVIIILVVSLLGVTPTVRFLAKNTKKFATYIEDITSENTTSTKTTTYGRISNDHDMLADGQYAHRRRSPAQKQWDVPEHDEM